jgi:hypothetical protein
MKKIVAAERTIKNGLAFKSQLERNMRASARRRSGTKPAQNLLHKKARRGTGEERMIQKENPS